MVHQVSTPALRAFGEWSPELGEEVYVDPRATVIGQVKIGAHSSVWPGAIIRGDMHAIQVGHRVSVQDNAVLHITHASHYNPKGFPLSIGNDVTIGHGACLHGCTVGNEVLIGINATVLDGAVIKEKVVLAAHSLVAPGKTLESGFLYMGSPAKKIRPLSEQELRFFRYSADNYVKLKNQYMEP